MTDLVATEQAAAGIRAAQANLADHRAATAKLQTRIAKLEATVQADKAAFTQLADVIATRNLDATLEDRPLPPESADERRTLKRLRSSIDAGTKAVPILKSEVDQRLSSERNLARDITDAFWPFKAAFLDHDLPAVRNALAALVPLLSRLSALDEVQRQIVGSGFATSPTVRREVLLSTSRLVDRLISALPQQVKPDALEAAAFDQDVRHATAEILTLLEN